METQLLFEELTPVQAGLVIEAEQGANGQFTWLNGIFMQADIKNKNGRVYPITELTAAVQGAQQRIKEANGIFGELDHPQTLTINLDRISHVITEMRMDGSNAYGRAKLLGTPTGLIAKELVNSGVALGVSSRGAGAVNEGGGVSGFQFVTVDLVAQPSAPGAYPTAVMESLDKYRRGHIVEDLATSLVHDPRAQDYFKKEVQKWLSEGLFSKR